MLRRKTSQAKKRKFQVYDLEWIPGDVKRAQKHGFEPMQLRLLGLFDGERYRSFYEVKDFMNAVCTQANHGTWFYAHAGGLADLIFVVEFLIDYPSKHFEVDCVFSGSAAIIVKITKGRFHWYFIDSYWLIRQSLREIGGWLGKEKGGKKEGMEMFYAPMPELKSYNELDCRILYEAIATFENHILDLGGELQRTVASTAMDLFRRRFLKQDIATADDVNLAAREAYFASRVEVFHPKCQEADYYDINSSFPYAMTFEAPGHLKLRSSSLKEGDMGLVKAKIRVPDCNIPTMPYRGLDNRVYFPTGTWEGWFSSVDMEYLEQNGGQIMKVHEAISFEPFHDLKGYAETIYEWRRKSESPALKVVLKFLLNSLYGKFGEGSMKQRVYLNAPAWFFKKHQERMPGGEGWEMLMPGVHALVENRDIPHAHVPIAVHITAIARRELARHMLRAPDVYYCDTDGFAIPAPSALPVSDKLGMLKYEKMIRQGIFAAPKLYAMRNTHILDYASGDGEEVLFGEWNVKGKGFSRIAYEDEEGNKKTTPLRYEDFVQLLEHKDLHLEQFARLRSMFRDGKVYPHEKLMGKTWTGRARNKRKADGKETTRPWQVSELQ